MQDPTEVNLEGMPAKELLFVSLTYKIRCAKNSNAIERARDSWGDREKEIKSKSAGFVSVQPPRGALVNRDIFSFPVSECNKLSLRCIEMLIPALVGVF